MNAKPLAQQARAEELVDPPIIWFTLLGLLCIPLMLIVVIGVQKFNPFSDQHWLRPTHASNPVNFRQPLNFFHFAGFMMLATGAGIGVGSLWSGGEALLYGFIGTAGGGAVLLGVHLVSRLFIDTSARRPASLNPPSVSTPNGSGLPRTARETGPRQHPRNPTAWMRREAG